MKKIMFNDKYGLTAAVLDGRKTMTRRIVPQAVIDMWDNREWTRVRTPYPDYYNMSMEEFCLEHAHYQLGEVVAVAQAYKDISNYFPDASAGWTNKMFVRADYMPHQIRITNIRVERLQDISGEDCLKEGIMQGDFMNTWDRFYFDSCYGDVPNHITKATPRAAFAVLIDKVSGKGTWDKNPLVFVYEFELIK